MWIHNFQISLPTMLKIQRLCNRNTSCQEQLDQLQRQYEEQAAHHRLEIGAAQSTKEGQVRPQCTCEFV